MISTKLFPPVAEFNSRGAEIGGCIMYVCMVGFACMESSLENEERVEMSLSGKGG